MEGGGGFIKLITRIRISGRQKESNVLYLTFVVLATPSRTLISFEWGRSLVSACQCWGGVLGADDADVVTMVMGRSVG